MLRVKTSVAAKIENVLHTARTLRKPHNRQPLSSTMRGANILCFSSPPRWDALVHSSSMFQVSNSSRGCLQTRPKAAVLVQALQLTRSEAGAARKQQPPGAPPRPSSGHSKQNPSNKRTHQACSSAALFWYSRGASTASVCLFSGFGRIHNMPSTALLPSSFACEEIHRTPSCPPSNICSSTFCEPSPGKKSFRRKLLDTTFVQRRVRHVTRGFIRTQYHPPTFCPLVPYTCSSQGVSSASVHLSRTCR